MRNGLIYVAWDQLEDPSAPGAGDPNTADLQVHVSVYDVSNKWEAASRPDPETYLAEKNMYKPRKLIPVLLVLALAPAACGVGGPGSESRRGAPPLSSTNPAPNVISDGLAGGCVECEYGAWTERVGVLRSEDGGATWKSLGHACFHAPWLNPVDVSPIAVPGGIALFFFDLNSLGIGKTRAIYRADTDGDVSFGLPAMAFSQSAQDMTDPYVLKLADGSYRMYVNSDRLLSATSGSADGGHNFQWDTGFVGPDGGTPGALLLPDGRVRLFVNIPGADGIMSYDSSDQAGRLFPTLPVLRVGRQDTGSGIPYHPHPIALKRGGYVMTFLTNAASGAVGDAQIRLATSRDGDTWKVVPGYVTNGSVPSLVEAADGSLLMYYVDFKDRATIVTAEKEPPISKYVYGQFIEYQGRCINGGIWAEMLQDRKFFDCPTVFVDPTKSPAMMPPPVVQISNQLSAWYLNAADTNVVMDPVDTYVPGIPVPSITLDNYKPRGLIQNDLGIKSPGLSYDGRIVAAGSGVDSFSVSLVWGTGPSDRTTVQLARPTLSFSTQYFTFPAAALPQPSDSAWLEIIATGQGTLRLAAVSLMPADNVYGMRADVFDLLQQLNAPVYRWPGGAAVDDYDFSEALGDPDRRPTVPNTSYFSRQLESHDFGPDEFINMCQLLGAEPYVALQAAYRMPNSTVPLSTPPPLPAGSQTDAAIIAHDVDEMVYFSKAAVPVRFWGVGNETFFKFTKVVGTRVDYPDIDAYLPVHNDIATALKASFPGAPLIGVGQMGEWSLAMLRGASPLDFISDHIYAETPATGAGADAKLMAALRGATSEMTVAYRRYRRDDPSIAAAGVPVVFDEFNLSHVAGGVPRPDVYGEAAPRWYMRDALAVALGLHEVLRNTDLVRMVNTHAVNVFGQVKTTKTAAAMDVTGFVWQLYRNRFGETPVAISGGINGLDIVAALSADGKTLTLGVVNPSPDPVTFALNSGSTGLELDGFTPGPSLTQWSIAAPASAPKPLEVFNEPGVAPVVTPTSQTLLTTTPITVGGYSINLLEIPSI